MNRMREFQVWTVICLFIPAIAVVNSDYVTAMASLVAGLVSSFATWVFCVRNAEIAASQLTDNQRQKETILAPPKEEVAICECIFCRAKRSKRARQAWKRNLNSMINIPRADLVEAYKDTILDVLSQVDIYEAEGMQRCPHSKLLRMGSDVEGLSFHDFCKALGR